MTIEGKKVEIDFAEIGRYFAISDVKFEKGEEPNSLGVLKPYRRVTFVAEPRHDIMMTPFFTTKLLDDQGVVAPSTRSYVLWNGGQIIGKNLKKGDKYRARFDLYKDSGAKIVLVESKR